MPNAIPSINEALKAEYQRRVLSAIRQQSPSLYEWANKWLEDHGDITDLVSLIFDIRDNVVDDHTLYQSFGIK